MNGEHQPVPKTSWRRRTVSGVIIVVLTLVLLELALRAVGLANPVLYERDEATGFRLKPNQHVRYLGNSIDINPWGVRDPRPLTDNSASKLRILVLGDSVTWGGIRIRQEDLFTSVAERNLPGSEVINAGVNGYSVARMAALYRAHLQGLHPSVVVLYAIPSDFVRPVRLVLVRDSVAFPLNKPLLALPVAFDLARLYAYHRFGWTWLRTEPDTLAPGPEQTDAERLQANVEAVVSLDKEIKAAHRSLLVVFAPTLGRNGDDRIPAQVREMLDRERVDCLTLDKALGQEPKPLTDGVHLSTLGHEQVGNDLARNLSRLLDEM